MYNDHSSILLPAIHKLWPALMSRLKELRAMMYMTTTAQMESSSRRSSSVPMASIQSLDENSYNSGPLLGRTDHSLLGSQFALPRTSYTTPLEIPGPHSHGKTNLSRKTLRILPKLLVLFFLNEVISTS